jgi:XRE family aerobic/anaerobic benzoate catabolism transcriptional regulator
MAQKDSSNVDPTGTSAPSNGRRTRREEKGGDGTYLSLLGDRVRTLRSRRGMTRKILAHNSGVSERYLAQLESGDGNISIMLLRQVAEAMGVPLEDLVTEAPERSVELNLLIEFACRLTPDQLTSARRQLGAAFGTGTSDQRRHRIGLIGLRGAGKSTLGKMLAESKGLPFVELTKEVEHDAGMALAEIMALGGQSMYRRFERRALERVLADHDKLVIATGGGLVAEPANYDALLSNCFTVWITAAPEDHMSRVITQGDRRPMADNPEAMDDLRLILKERATLYAKADARLDTEGKSVASSLAELTALVKS